LIRDVAQMRGVQDANGRFGCGPSSWFVRRLEFVALITILSGCVIFPSEPEAEPGLPIAAVLRDGNQLLIAPGACGRLEQVHVTVRYGNSQLSEESDITVWETTIDEVIGTIVSPQLDARIEKAVWIVIEVVGSVDSQKVEFLLGSDPNDLRRGADRDGGLAVPIEAYAHSKCQS
jgi:hypothetical protein